MPQQQLAFDYAKDRACIALFKEMRLGKTTVAIRWTEHNDLKKVLVICPDTVKASWEKELRAEEVADEDIINLNQSGEAARCGAAGQPGKWCLITYSSVLYGPAILDMAWDCVILDESTAIKNPQAQITKLLRKKRDLFKYRAVLSGMPDPESVLDYYEQMAFVWGSFMGCCDYWHFRRKYFAQFGYDWQCSKATESRIRDAVGNLAFVMTRKQAGLGSRKIRQVLQVELNAEQKKILGQIRDGFEIEALSREDYGEDTKWVPVKYQWESVVAGGFSPHGVLLSNAKTAAIIELLKGDLKNEQVVIWFRYTHEIRHTAAQLAKAGIAAVTFTGKDKSKASDFTNGSARVICAQARCGQYSLDWSCSSTAIYYSNWPDGQVRAQSEDRIVHPKKAEPLLYIDVVTKDTLDEDMIELLKNKKLTSRRFMEALAKRRML